MKKKVKKKNNRRREVIGILLLVISALTFLSLFTYNTVEEPTIPIDSEITNFMGIFGIFISHYLIKFTIGWAAFAFPIILGMFGIYFVAQIDLKKTIQNSLYLLGLSLWISLVIGFACELNNVSYDVYGAGLFGGILSKVFLDFLGLTGSIIIIVIYIVLLIIGYFKLSIHNGYVQTKQFISNQYNTILSKRRLKSVSQSAVILEEPQSKLQLQPETKPEIETESKPESELIKEDIPVETIVEEDVKIKIENIEDEPNVEITIEDVDEIEEGNLDAQKKKTEKYRQYKLPSIEYLKNPVEIGAGISREELENKASHLEHALSTFGVHGNVVRISPGPVITLFEIEPAEGVRVNKFTNLSDDLARIMKAQRIRIIAPIPGSKSVGVELPNVNPEIVWLKSIINSEKFIQSKSKLTVAVGKNTTGDAYVFDLSKMPHILIAGATGSGKSVCINTLIVSLLYKAKPDEVKFIMMDPKKLELSTYKALEGYHLITSPNLDEYVMTTAENSVGILNAALTEMERRYQVFADATVRNIGEYHKKCKIDSKMETVPYIVVIVDELADLMITSGRDIEEPITRLAQMARAVGIHLVLATQRPSVDVITGLIKANFPARIAFQVSQKVDSRTIIDQIGAEKLLGNGDLLFFPPGVSAPIRLHNAFITLDEIEDIMDYISSQPKPEEIHLPEVKKKKDKKNPFQVDNERDELFMDAAHIVIENQQASVSLLQRRLRIGYSRAGRLIDELEALGIISGHVGSKARDVLVDSTYLDNLID